MMDSLLVVITIVILAFRSPVIRLSTFISAFYFFFFFFFFFIFLFIFFILFIFFFCDASIVVTVINNCPLCFLLSFCLYLFWYVALHQEVRARFRSRTSGLSTRLFLHRLFQGTSFVAVLLCACVSGFICGVCFDIIWSSAWQNLQNGMCAQRRLRSAWTSAQSDQCLCCALNG